MDRLSSSMLHEPLYELFLIGKNFKYFSLNSSNALESFEWQNQRKMTHLPFSGELTQLFAIWNLWICS